MIVLGPVPCQGCRHLVWWDGWTWRGGNRNGHTDYRHVCKGKRHA